MWVFFMIAFIELNYNQFINECARKKKARMPEFQSFPLFWSDVEELKFLMKYKL